MGLGLLLTGLAGLATALGGLARDVGWIAQPFYAWAWWSTILALDGLAALRRGDSLLTARRRQWLRLSLWSVSFWFFFELLNLRYQNWYYVGVAEAHSFQEALLQGAFGIACFATVFVGIFETCDVLSAFGWFRALRRRPRRFPRWVSYAVQGVGLLMVALSLTLSEYLAPLVWGSMTLILDPWNYRRGGRSLLHDLERGQLGVVLRLVLAGLACGLVWESFNYFAPQKWVYTVRGLEGLKLFEMPLPGFLGFPALALDAFAAYSCVAYLFHGNATWEHPADCGQHLEPRPALSARALAGMLPLHAALWSLVTVLAQSVNIGSVQVDLDDLEGLGTEKVEILRRHGIHRPLQLLREARDPEHRREIRLALGLFDAGFDRLIDEADLYMFKGIGRHHGALLRRLGIQRVEELAAADPEALYREMVRLREGATFPALRVEMVRVWVADARGENRLRQP